MKWTARLVQYGVAAVVFAGAHTAVAAELTKVVYGNPSEIGLSQAPAVVAKALGYFRDEGLDVEIASFKGTGTLLPQILAHRVDIGFLNADTLIISRAPGQSKVPVKFFYNGARSSVWEFAVLADSPYKSLKDLNGQTVGVGAMSWGNMPITRAQFKELGITSPFLPVGTGASAFLALTSKQVAALNLYDTEIATLEAQGVAIRRLPQLPRAQALFSNGFVAHDDMIRDKPDVLKGFGRAYAKATVFCETNPVACVKTYWSEYPNMRPTGEPDKVLADAVKILNSRMSRVLDFPAGEREYGKYDAQVWKDFADALFEGGQISTKEVDVENCYTNAFVSDFSKFDAAAVKAQAAAMKD